MILILQFTALQPYFLCSILPVLTDLSPEMQEIHPQSD